MADPLWDSTGEVGAARARRALEVQMMSMYQTTPTTRLSDDDVRRVAEGVADELERRAAHPLRVTAADVRWWTGGPRG